jgi:AraC family transcriptional regulator
VKIGGAQKARDSILDSSPKGYSEFHFARLFKKITGVTPHSYLASLRIERARRMLAESDPPIAEVGYASQSHFTKIFREATGMTPREFRLSALSARRA